MDDLASVGTMQRQGGARPGVVLQRLPLARDVALRPLLLRAAAGVFPTRARIEDGVLRLAPGAAISFDTYLGACFEPAWREAGVGAFALDLEGEGAAVLRVLRRDAQGAATLLHEAEHRLRPGLSIPVPPPRAEAGAGRLCAELVAGGGGATLAGLAWRAPAAVPRPVGLVPVFCTFGREARLAAALAGLVENEADLAPIPRIVVVNQGAPGLARHPALAGLPDALRARLAVIEQGNFGGAGGFTRGLLAAREVPGATHAVLMDDDVATEPEALRRAAAFFALAPARLALGGHMLDLQRPTDLYEAGALVDPARLHLRPLLHRRALGPRRGLDALIRPPAMHYNGWWFFGLPLPLLDEVGLPLPCFIRGDDVEFGLRLRAQGIATVSVPGVAIWHEPFYAKLHGWQGYYELRNALVFASLHLPRPPRALALLLAKRLLGHLLSWRYHEAALTLRAGRDWLRGPAILDAPPAALHAEVTALRRAHPALSLAPVLAAEALVVPPDPPTPAHFVARLLRLLWRNAVVPVRPSPPRRVAASEFLWFRLGGADQLAVDSGHETSLPVFARDRATFRRQALEGIRLVAAVLRRGGAAQQAWRDAAPRLASAENWRRVLGLP